MNIQCTKQMLDMFRIKGAGTLDNIGNDLENWHCNVFIEGRTFSMLLLNDATSFVFYVPGFSLREMKNMEDIVNFLVDSIYAILPTYGLEPNEISAVLSILHTFGFYKNSSRSLVTKINAIYKQISTLLPHYNTINDVQKIVNNNISSATKTKPIDAFKDMLLKHVQLAELDTGEFDEVFSDEDNERIGNELMEKLYNLKSEIPLHSFLSDIFQLDLHEDDIKASLRNMRELPDFGYYNEESGIYYPKSMIFSKLSFLVKPTQEELEKKRLFLGHRFTPIIKHADNTGTVSFLYKEKELRKVDTAEDIQEMQIYMGAMSVMSLFGTFDSQNRIQMTQLEINDIIKESDFKDGDYFIFTPVDYENMIYAVSVIKQKELAMKQMKTNFFSGKLYESFMEAVSHSHYPRYENMVVEAFAKQMLKGELQKQDFVYPVSHTFFKNILENRENIGMSDVGILFVWPAGAEEPEGMREGFEEFYRNVNMDGFFDEQD